MPEVDPVSDRQRVLEHVADRLPVDPAAREAVLELDRRLFDAVEPELRTHGEHLEVERVALDQQQRPDGVDHLPPE